MSKVVIYGNKLYHHGILGQKWGTRRWQNEDGSLTPEGREHYGYGDGKNGKTISGLNKISKAVKTINKIMKDGVKTEESDRARHKREKIEDFESKNPLLKSTDRLKYDREIEKINNQFKDGEDPVAQENMKKILTAGATVAGIALTAYGAYKIADNINYKNAVKAGNAAANKVLMEKSVLLNMINTTPIKNANYKRTTVGSQTLEFIKNLNGEIVSKYTGIDESTAYSNAFNDVRKKIFK